MFLSAQLVIQAYKKGLFPMSESSENPYIFWVNPEERGIIYLQDFKVPKSLKKFMKKNTYSIKFNENFSQVINLCARNKFRRSTWINKQIIDSYINLFNNGKAISIEYFENKKMLGGLYGVILGEIFCGESMFSLAKNASKVCITHLAALLKDSGFRIIDTQFYSDHLSQFGTIKIPKNEYLKILNKNNNKSDLKVSNLLKKNIMEYF